MRRTLVILLGVGLLAAGCGKETGPQHFSINVDAASPAGKKFQVAAFFPGTIKASPGDTITFVSRGTEAPHTITFGIKPDRSNQPPLLTAKGENPIDFAPCFSATVPTPAASSCAQKTLPPYAGTGFWNSGLVESANSTNKTPKSVTVTLAANIAKGSYAFVCVLHPFMAGTLEVVDPGQRVSQKDITTQATTDAAKALTDAAALKPPASLKTGTTVAAIAGWGDRIVAVNRFSPTLINIKTGESVQWTAANPYELHTVTFGAPPKGSPFAPSGVKSGSAYTGGDANSGIFGAPGPGPLPSAPFVLKFTTAGSYPFQCLLHPGQTGTVNVT